MKENNGKEGKENVIFSQKAKAQVKKIADFSRKTKIWKETEMQREEFWRETKDATPALVYGYLLDRVVKAPTIFHSNSSIILLMPKLDELLNGTEGTDEFEKPTPLDTEVRQWKLAVILPCRYGPRKRSMTELLFCMLRSGH